MDLALIWFGILCLALLAYVVLDGFDLGIGLLFPLGGDDQQRGLMMDSIAPVWDGNETWLVLGGGGLLAAFPLAYSVLLTAFYMPVIVMLLALILRGVAFEYRSRTVRGRWVWDWSFTGGSALAAFCQGVMVGAWVQGVRVEQGAYAGGWFDWLSPFSVLCGLALVCGYALLGACWLVMKTEGELQARLRRLQMPLGALTIGFIGLVSFGTLMVSEGVRARWLGGAVQGQVLFLWLIPMLTAGFGLWFARAVRHERERTPFVLALALFGAAFAGLGASLFPYLVPPSITYDQAANPDSSLAFMLVGTLVLLPVILAYTAHNYWVFRGKIRPGEGYH